MLLAVPNISEGRHGPTIAEIARAFATGKVRLLDTHSDPDHNRTVFTLAGEQGAISSALVAGARRAVETLDISDHLGAHPLVGAIDVAPVVYTRPEDRGPACAEALTVADRIAAELSVPVFLYGELTGGQVTRAAIRQGGPRGLEARLAAGKLAPDFGPAALHPTAGAVLVAARPPLVAFNVELAPPATVETAREIAALIREGGSEGLPGVRAIGVHLDAHDTAQVSTNVEDHRATTLAALVQAIARHATPLRAELVGLAPAAAFDGFPADLPVTNRRHLEDALTL